MSRPAGSGEVRRLPAAWRTPVGRGYILLAAMSLAFGLSMNTSNAVTTNYFADVLHFTGPQFGYITAIREIPGLLLIFITALLYRMSQQRLTALALVVLAVGVAGYALATSFSTVLPWVVLGSLGFHTVLQTQVALGMSLSVEAHSGRVLGVMAGIGQAGALVGMTAVMLLFLRWPDAYHEVYVVCGLIALLGAAAIVGFPHLHEGKPIAAQMPRQRIVAQARLPLLLRPQRAGRRPAAAVLLVRPVGAGEPLRHRACPRSRWSSSSRPWWPWCSRPGPGA